mmetsp:Transcript_17968/g.25398  ORF Transcript_17968/g.25398 Transcript_17968/m.25398 type:complete len:80 (-) Transcript_17968:1170-1409(-)
MLCHDIDALITRDLAPIYQNNLYFHNFFQPYQEMGENDVGMGVTTLYHNPNFLIKHNKNYKCTYDSLVDEIIEGLTYAP